MTSLAAALRAFLLADPQIAATLGDRLRPNQAAPSDALPYAVYALRSSGGREPVPAGGLVEYTLELFFAGSYDQIGVLADQVRRRLDQWRGDVGGRSVRGAFLRDEDDDHVDVSGSQIGFDSKLQTWTVWVKEPLPAAV